MFRSVLRCSVRSVVNVISYNWRQGDILRTEEVRGYFDRGIAKPTDIQVLNMKVASVQADNWQLLNRGLLWSLSRMPVFSSEPHLVLFSRSTETRNIETYGQHADCHQQ